MKKIHCSLIERNYSGTMNKYGTKSVVRHQDSIDVML